MRRIRRKHWMMRGGSILGMSWRWMIVGASGSSRYVIIRFEKIFLINRLHLEHQKSASTVIDAFKNTDGTVDAVFTNIASTGNPPR